MSSVACARLVPVTLRPCPAAAATAARMPLFPAACPELRGPVRLLIPGRQLTLQNLFTQTTGGPSVGTRTQTALSLRHSHR